MGPPSLTLALLAGLVAGCGGTPDDAGPPAAGLAGTPASAGSTGVRTSATRGPGNILVIVYDDLGVDAPGCYAVGGDPAPMPNFDALAAQGVRFTNVWSMPVCSPTRAAIQSGRYGWRTGIGDLVRIPEDGHYFAESEVALPEMLNLGTGGRYATAAIGKWHLGNVGAEGKAPANLNGYDYFSGGFLRRPGGYFQWRHNENGVEDQRTGYLTTQTFDDARRWLSDAPEPWFCYLALHAPHTELHVPPEELCSLRVEEGREPSHREMWKAMIEAADRRVGELVGGLGDARDRTTIFLTADNGTAETAGPPGVESRRGKGSVRQGGIHVPLIVVGPDVARPGSTCDALVHSLDLFATIADLGGVDLEATLPEVVLDSVSLLPYLEDPDGESRRPVLYTEVFRPNGVGRRRGQDRRAIRDARYKLIRTSNHGDSLFDLLEDPFERNDLLEDQPSEPAQAAHRKLAQAMTEFGPGQ